MKKFQISRHFFLKLQQGIVIAALRKDVDQFRFVSNFKISDFVELSCFVLSIIVVTCRDKGIHISLELIKKNITENFKSGHEWKAHALPYE